MVVEYSKVTCIVIVKAIINLRVLGYCRRRLPTIYKYQLVLEIMREYVKYG